MDATITMKQADLGLNLSRKKTRKREFLEEMTRVVPWKDLTALIEPLMMVLIGGIVFVFILGVFLPVMGIVNSLSGGAH